MARFKKISEAEAAELGRGNHDGWQDYIKARPSAVKRDEATTPYDRGYLAGYRIAAKGRRPVLMQ